MLKKIVLLFQLQTSESFTVYVINVNVPRVRANADKCLQHHQGCPDTPKCADVICERPLSLLDGNRLFHQRMNCKSLVENSSHSSYDHIHLHQQIMESNKYFSDPFCIFFATGYSLNPCNRMKNIGFPAPWC